MPVAKAKGVFCPHCGSENTLYDDYRLEDGDDLWSIYKEYRTCKDCGKEFALITEWKLSGFTFCKEDGTLEDVDYEIIGGEE